MDAYLAGLATEKVNDATREIDRCSTAEMVALIGAQDALVAGAVAAEQSKIAAAVDLIYDGLRQGGRLIYLGAGTSGRLGVLDASECLPTFGVSSELVQGHIAGGDIALRHAVEGCEDDGAAGVQLVEKLKVGQHDTVVGITASGYAPYVIAAVRAAKEKGAATVGLVTNVGSRLADEVDVCIAPAVGPEVISGSTRMKSGTAQKMVLNMLSTCAMIKLGKVYGNLMVDLVATNEKLKDRSLRLIAYATGATAADAADCLDRAGGRTKTAILMYKTGLGPEAAEALLAQHGGRLSGALGREN
ncbi:MAG: N-acetylmuramic acid 6-phosphate etherase [Pseudoflavonifractor sp.]